MERLLHYDGTMRMQIRRVSRFLVFLMVSSLALPTAALAHGGEDHGDQKPQTTATEKGIVVQTKRIGDIELMLKHPELLPDTATEGKLFLTKFESNEPAGNTLPVIEIESSNGSTLQAIV